MKKSHFIGFYILLSTILLSCSSTVSSSASEKAVGEYLGSLSSNPSSQFNITITADGANHVNMYIPGPGTFYVSVSIANDSVIFSYNNGSAINNQDMVSINGSLVGNGITLTLIRVNGTLPSTVTSYFTGVRQ